MIQCNFYNVFLAFMFNAFPLMDNLYLDSLTIQLTASGTFLRPPVLQKKLERFVTSIHINEQVVHFLLL